MIKRPGTARPPGSLITDQPTYPPGGELAGRRHGRRTPRHRLRRYACGTGGWLLAWCSRAGRQPLPDAGSA